MQTNQPETMGSLWGGLSPHLLAQFYEVFRREDGTWARADANVTVVAPLEGFHIEAVLNWQSPFEQTGAESKAPMLLSMLQSGAFQETLTSVRDAGNLLTGNAAQSAADAVNRSQNFMKQFEGRSGITKLNSTQVFTGMQPVKIQATALFRAWRDPQAEVVKPVNQLWRWALPEALAPESTIVSRVADAASGKQSALDILMPSKAPVRIALYYKGHTYSPLVIESIDYPDSATTAAGQPTEKKIQLSLGSLTAWGRDDWAGLSGK